MRVQSFIRQGDELGKVEIELTLQPGLPQIHFLGLPDTALRESSLRIRSAIRSQGFHLPQAQQILVHLRPTHLRKTSRGLDLAVAAALLWETEQIPPPPAPGSIPLVYGALTLTGEVEIPDDADELDIAPLSPVITGVGTVDLPYATWRLGELKDLRGELALTAPRWPCAWRRPAAPVKSYPRPAALLAAVIAAGEHPALIAGPPGSGKSTLVDSVPSWLEEPTNRPGSDLRRLAKKGQAGAWRPIVRPHHSITPLAMIGGGGRLYSGEITRAHGGVLIMDELLEFESEIQEALREPMEAGQITIARGGRVKTFPSRSLVLATTNLCECGHFVPGEREKVSLCRCTRSQRRRTLARLTGPFADRFAILAYSDAWRGSCGGEVAAEKIAETVERAIEFRRRARHQELPNQLVPFANLEAELSPFHREYFLEGIAHQGSRRRFEAVVRIARTLADLAASPHLRPADLDDALAFGSRGHRVLEEWRE